MASKTVGGWTALALLVTFAPELAFGQGTDRQRDACTPDAFRLCGQFIPDADRITTCLRAAGPRLSPPCYAVFYPPRADVDSRNNRRRYFAPPPPAERDDDE